MPQQIIGLVGQLGSGKGVVTRYLAEAYDAQTFKFSTYLSRILDILGLDQSRDHLVKVSEAVREKFGEDILSSAMAKDVTASTVALAVLDGLRRPEDLTMLRDLPNFILVVVTATPEIRYQRISARGEKTDEHHITWEEFLGQEQRSTELTIPATMKLASYTIENNGTEEELCHAVDELMKTLHIPRL